MAITKSRIMIVDDHPVVQMALKGLIDATDDLEVCGQADNAADALTIADQVKPDLYIIDLVLDEGTSGLQLIKRLKAHDEEARFLVVSMREEELFAERALRAGALGYVNKRELTENILEAIQRVLADKVYLSQNMTERLLHGMVAGEGTSTVSMISKLSNRELEVFDMIGQGVSAAQIADKLNLSVKTIETHREKIKKKLGVDSTSELNRIAIKWNIDGG